MEYPRNNELLTDNAAALCHRASVAFYSLVHTLVNRRIQTNCGVGAGDRDGTPVCLNGEQTRCDEKWPCMSVSKNASRELGLLTNVGGLIPTLESILREKSGIASERGDSALNSHRRQSRRPVRRDAHHVRCPFHG